ncbi:dihydrofolate reductase [Limosilactobacillus sp. STM2_1]|uniref:Dihydrofolate reductase n=1 Tax=Limosilactobacillus rudii TaxID=2759755 RepID=A0A7W3UK82_9LACO|nr:dihydrofolate reductase [Limosilactobacillus rudii]MBB1079096.1 dihydrofolate reductase [Limosilactobacillus rudii]MBB1097029.1 dihydrofolate reductase [Limosilactobacillus rudii]MCD7133997.1 dihydrofolate reductase [Limosilactobacillus rudii]
MGEIRLIWAEDLDGWIGKENTIPWHVSADMKHFRHQTLGYPIVMGRKTFESLGNKPLPKRKNIILTNHQLSVSGVVVVHSLSELKAYFQKHDADYYVIGGATIYKQLLPLATKLYRTVINKRIDGDTKMPAINYDRWHLVKQVNYDENGRLICRFEEWQLDVQ